MLEAFGERFAPSQSVQAVVAAGRTGRKGKKGFYLYDEKGKKGGVDPSVYELLPTGAAAESRCPSTRFSGAACWRW